MRPRTRVLNLSGTRAGNNIRSSYIQKVSMTEIDGAWKSVFDKKVRYRYVIDMKAS